jgi:gamma-polyglutamate biosynthesis protein CapA
MRKIIFVIVFAFVVVVACQKTLAFFDSYNIVTLKNKGVGDVNIKMLFVGDIFLDRGIDKLRQKSTLNFAYPFSGLETLNKKDYDAWVGNLECPVTNAQSTKREKEVDLRFSCRPEYMKELKKYFEIVSLANNHTDNMGGAKGMLETQKYLKEEGIEYFGHFDNSQVDEICKVIEVKNVPIAFCGYNNVFKLPTQSQIDVIKNYSSKYITIIYPHQGEEYKFKNNAYQQKIYRKYIDAGADIVFGSHPHVVQNVEEYKGKIIFYSLGNFIFDQSWSKTREHMVVDTEIKVLGFDPATSTKPNFQIKYKPIFTHADKDFITKKRELSAKEYAQILKDIGFAKIASTSKQ